jgi:ABC-2 type transport system permease protein
MSNSESNRLTYPARGVPLARLCWIGFKTSLIRSHQDIVRHYMFTIALTTVTTLLYCAVFRNFIGRQVGNVDDMSYAQFIAPGLILLPTIASSYGQAGLALVVAKLFRQIEEQLASPQPSWMLVVNYVAGGALRGMLVGIVAGIVTLIFMHATVERPLMSFAVLLLVSMVSSVSGFMNGVFAKTMDQMTWVTSFVLTPLTYLSGVFYSVSQLPAWAQRLSQLDPVFYLLNLFRYSMSGVSDGHLGISLAVILVVTSAMFGAAVALMARGYGIRE